MAVLRLDPNVPIVWRSPFTLQLGGEPARLILDDITEAEERMLAALVAGVPRRALPVEGRCTAIEAERFLDRLRPFLASDPRTACSYSVRARGVHHQLVGATARTLGLITRADGPAPRRRVGIVVGTHAIPPGDYRDWLRRDLPHLGVVFADDRVQVSHVVVPGRTPCLRCADLWRCDEDPDWPVLATQLVERPAASMLDAILRAEALGVAARALAGADAQAAAHGAVLTGRERLDPGPPRPHPDCGCTLDLQRPLP